MKRYQAHPSDDGRWFILDSTTNLVIAWVGSKDVAERAVDHINKDYESKVTKTA